MLDLLLMARVVVVSAAYLGDVAPFVEPANQLVDRGHDVTLLTPRGFHGLLDGERFKLAEYPLDFSPSGIRADPTHERLMRHPWINQARLARYWMRRGFASDPTAAAAATVAAFRDADVVVTHPTMGVVTMPAAAHLDIPVVVGQLFPMMMPTNHWGPPVGRSSLDLHSSRLHRLTWRALARVSGAGLYDSSINRYRSSLGVEPLRGNGLLAWTEAARTVVLVSRHYFGDEAPDWPDWPLCGFSAWPGPTGQTVDDHVVEFLDGGDAPVMVCLGTSAAAGAGAAFATIAAGLNAQGLRALSLVGSADNLAALEGVPGAIEFAPVPSVVPRCRAAVVSGALGTLAATLSAGVPVVVVPQLFDQVWHANRVEELGVGILASRPTKVAAAVARLLSDPNYTQRAQALGAKLRAENGATALADTVEALI